MFFAHLSWLMASKRAIGALMPNIKRPPSLITSHLQHLLCRYNRGMSVVFFTTIQWKPFCSCSYCRNFSEKDKLRKQSRPVLAKEPRKLWVNLLFSLFFPACSLVLTLMVMLSAPVSSSREEGVVPSVSALESVNRFEQNIFIKQRFCSRFGDIFVCCGYKSHIRPDYDSSSAPYMDFTKVVNL